MLWCLGGIRRRASGFASGTPQRSKETVEHKKQHHGPVLDMLVLVNVGTGINSINCSVASFSYGKENESHMPIQILLNRDCHWRGVERSVELILFIAGVLQLNPFETIRRLHCAIKISLLNKDLGDFDRYYEFLHKDSIMILVSGGRLRRRRWHHRKRQGQQKPHSCCSKCDETLRSRLYRRHRFCR
jgi:hypothetical protein